MSLGTLKRCGCCRKQGSCPFDKIAEGEVLKNPSAEHCAVVRVGDVVYKYLKPRADTRDWRRRAKLSRRLPEIFVPFTLSRRVVTQEFVPGGDGTEEDVRRLYAALRERGVVGVHDIVRHNIRGGRVIDFGFTPDVGSRTTTIIKGDRRLQRHGPRRMREPRT